jgi:hypothetical protein
MSNSCATRLFPSHQSAVGVENADALIYVLQRGPDHTGLVIEQLATFGALHADQVSNVGLENDSAAIGCSLLADLKPAVTTKPDIEDLPCPVQAHALGYPGFGGHAAGEGEVRGAAGGFHIVGKGNAGSKFLVNVHEVPTEAGIAEHEHFSRIEERKPFLDGLDRLGQVTARALRGAVGLVEQFQRRFEIPRTLTNPFFEHGRTPELLEGGATVAGILLDMAHQRVSDDKHFLEVAAIAIGRIKQAVGNPGAHEPPSETTVPGG